MMFAVGTLLVSNLALTSPWLQVLSNYPLEVSEKQHHRASVQTRGSGLFAPEKMAGGSQLRRSESLGRWRGSPRRPVTSRSPRASR
jgi:hypothetical protein